MREIPEEVARKLPALAWHRDGPAALIAAIVPYAESRDEARRLGTAWIEARRGAPERSLPGGQPRPPLANPWPLAANPFPGVEADVKSTLALAWRVLEGRAAGQVEDEVAVRRMQALLEPMPTHQGDAQRELRDWSASARPLQCVRAASSGLGEHGRLDEEGIAQLLALAARWDRAKGDFELSDVERAAFRLLVLAGESPRTALESVRAWDPWRGELPNGQWLPEELLPKPPAGPVVIGGVRLASATFMRVRQVLWHDAGRATQMLMHSCALSPVQARAVVKALGSGWAVEAKPVEEDAAASTRAPTGASPKASPRTRVERGIKLLLADFPLHWAILAQASLRESTAHETMWVSAPGDAGAPIALSYHPGFVDTLGELECAAVLLHEVHHLIFDHLVGPPQPLRGLLTERHRECWMLACECTANEHIAWPLPYEPIRIETLKLPPGESTTQRYRRLLARTKGLDAIRVALAEGAVCTCGRPGGRKTLLGGLSDDGMAQVGGIQVAIREALKRVGKSLDRETRGMLAGTMAGAELEELERVEGGNVSWQELLQTRVRSLTTRAATRMFPSRRAPERVGIVPGRRARRTRPVVLIAIDTSASMTGRDLALVAAEVRTLLRMQVRVAVVQCDVKIQAARWMRPHDDLVRADGRGGTDLRPPFEAKVLREYRPDLVAYFTDGDGEAPAAKPKGVEVVWVLTGAWAEVPAKWGRVVRMMRMTGAARTARMAR